MDPFEVIRQSVVTDQSNANMTAKGWVPLYSASATARLLVVGQAPGRKAQASAVPWNDDSGRTLMEWMGVSDATFRDPARVALLPMDFYYPGKGVSGDAPPRKGFAERWHPPLLGLMPHISLTVLIGKYAQARYLPSQKRETLTRTVHDFKEFLPEYFPVVHPSPLNFRWHAKNPWFMSEVVPDLRAAVDDALHDGD